MKLTDFALIFIGVTLPIIIIVYVNVSFTIKAQEQEIYYKKIINTALNDAANQMKEVENSDAEIDYGYSGTVDNKISVNAKVAIETFKKSLYNNFDIKGNESLEKYLMYFIPAIAIIDYNGVQVSSIEEYKKDDKTIIDHVVKPKKYYTYTYYVYKDSADGGKYKYTDDISKAAGGVLSTHILEFTMDDYVTHRGFTKSGKDIPVSSFYLSDTKNNYVLVATGGDSGENLPVNSDSLSSEEKKLLKAVGRTDSANSRGILEFLNTKKRETIVNTIQKEMEYATNNNNFYASNAGIKYNFVFPTLEVSEMESQIKNVGIMALVQGISMGNRYLNVRAYSTSKLTEINRYYLSIPKTPLNSNSVPKNLYHKTTICPEYRNSIHNNITPQYLFTKQQAASVNAVLKDEENNQYISLKGFYPCPICNP